jgi:hypothetical protein
MGRVAIRRMLFSWEAELLGARLRAAGIPCLVVESHARTYWTYTFALGGASVWVDQADLPRALEVLEQAGPGEDGNAGELGRCPLCSSDEVERLRPGPLWLLGSILLFVPMPFARRGTRCRACGHRWRPARTPPADPMPEELLLAERQIGVGQRELTGLFWVAFALISMALLWSVYRISHPGTG